jgi:hypothetical protein
MDSLEGEVAEPCLAGGGMGPLGGGGLREDEDLSLPGTGGREDPEVPGGASSVKHATCGCESTQIECKFTQIERTQSSYGYVG